jgi:hypothetical protein
MLQHGHPEEALQILADLHGKGDANHELVQLEFNEIKEQIEFDRERGARSYKELLDKDVRGRVVLGVSLQAWSQLTGMK